MHTQSIEYSVGETRYIGYVAVDRERAGNRPGILIAPEAGGLGDVTRDRARLIAELGYVALAIDYHGDGKVLEMDAMWARLGVLRGDPSIIRGITRKALETLLAQPEVDAARIGAIGYCYGGTAVLELARSGADVACTVGFHSGLSTTNPGDARNIKGKILVCIGAEDPLIQPAERAAFEQEMRATKVDWRMHLLGNAVHGFANPRANSDAFRYHKLSHERSWRAMRDLFDETF